MHLHFLIQNMSIEMLGFFKKKSIDTLQKKYERLMKEAYVLSKANPEESKRKQSEAIEVRKQIIAKEAA